MLIGSVVGMLSKNIDRRSMDSSRANLLALKAISLVLITFYKMLSPKLAHFQVDIITTTYLPGKLDVRGCPETFRNPGNDCCPPRCFK